MCGGRSALAILGGGADLDMTPEAIELIVRDGGFGLAIADPKDPMGVVEGQSAGRPEAGEGKFSRRCSTVVTLLVLL